MSMSTSTIDIYGKTYNMEYFCYECRKTTIYIKFKYRLKSKKDHAYLCQNLHKDEGFITTIDIKYKYKPLCINTIDIYLHVWNIFEDEGLIEFRVEIFSVNLRLVFRLLVRQQVDLGQCY
jgi:hypothetical protein